jgi:hypothetical protein
VLCTTVQGSSGKQATSGKLLCTSGSKLSGVDCSAVVVQPIIKQTTAVGCPPASTSGVVLFTGSTMTALKVFALGS